jgi:hypothetical protein
LNFFQEKSTSRLRVWTDDFASCSEFRDWSSILLDYESFDVLSYGMTGFPVYLYIPLEKSVSR